MAERGARVLWALDYFRNYGRPPADFLAEDFEAHQAETITGTAGVFTGKDALRDALVELAEGFDRLSFDTEEVVDKPDGTVAIRVRVIGRGRSSGIETENRISWLWTFEGDAAKKLQVFEDPEGAFEA